MTTPQLIIISHPPTPLNIGPECNRTTFPGTGVYEWRTEPEGLKVQASIDGSEWMDVTQPLLVDNQGRLRNVVLRIDPSEYAPEMVGSPLTYTVGEYVERDGLFYVCTVETEAAPPNAAYWDVYMPPEYSPGVYYEGDIVHIDDNGDVTYWICTAAESQSYWFSPDWTTWSPNSFGRWHPGDVVQVGVGATKVLYKCITDTNEVPPTAQWVIYQEGSDSTSGGGGGGTPTTRTYSVGEYVERDDLLYQCDAETDSPPPGAAWSEVTPEEWQAGFSYNEGYVVHRSINDTNYICIKSGGSQTVWYSPEWNEWTPDSWGQWHPGDTIVYGDVAYQCLRDTNTPPPGPDWLDVGEAYPQEPPDPTISITLDNWDISPYYKDAVVNGTDEADVHRSCSVNLGQPDEDSGLPSVQLWRPDSPTVSIRRWQNLVLKRNGETIFTGPVMAVGSGSTGEINVDAQGREVFGLGRFKCFESRSWDKGTSVGSVIREIVFRYIGPWIGDIAISARLNEPFTVGHLDEPWKVAADLAWAHGYRLFFNRFGDCTATKYDASRIWGFSTSDRESSNYIGTYSLSTSENDDFYDSVVVICTLSDGAMLAARATRAVGQHHATLEEPFEWSGDFPDVNDYPDGGYCAARAEALQTLLSEMQNAADAKLASLPYEDDEQAASFECAVISEIEPADRADIDGKVTRITGFSIPGGSGNMSIGSLRDVKRSMVPL